MNYMEQVAQMLGVELEEEFNVYKSKIVNKFTEDGIVSYSKDNQNCIRNYYLLENLLIGYTEIIKKPILDDIERRYLGNIIKPFRDRVVSIIKYDDYDRCEYIVIKYRNINGYTGRMYFPAFEKDTMYKGMKANKKYTLEELEL